jgi:DNA-binding MarR family transcriptional regulator
MEQERGKRLNTSFEVDGHWKMPHRIVGSLLAYHLTLMELKAVIFAIDQTYRCKRKWAKISTSQWAAALRIDRRNVFRLVKNLVSKNLIERRDGPGSIPEYRFQEDCQGWKVQKRPMPKLPKWEERAHRVISQEDSDQKTASISTDDTERESLPPVEPSDADVETLEKMVCLFCKKPINNPKPFQVMCDEHGGC